MKHLRSDGLYISFDLGSAVLKAVVLERQQGRDRIMAVEEENLKAASLFVGDNDYREHLIQAVRRVSERLPLKESKGNVALFNSREMQVKILELPGQIQRNQIEGVLKFEGRKLLSPNFRQEPFVIGYRILQESPLIVLLTCIPQSLLLRFLGVFDAAGVRLSAVYSEVFATFALSETQELGSVPTLALADVGHTSTHLTIFAAGELRFYRYIPAGIGEVTDFEQSQDLDMYFQKIRFSFDYFKAVSKLGQIEEIRFAGGGAAKGDFLDRAREYFAPTKTAPIDVSGRMDISAVLTPGSVTLGPNEAAVSLLAAIPAVGTLLAYLDMAGETADLLRSLQEYRHGITMERLTTKAPLYLGIAGLVVITLWLVYARFAAVSALEELHKRTLVEQAIVDGLKLKLVSASSMSKDDMAMLSEAERDILAPILMPHKMPAELLFLIAQARPKGIVVSKISISGDSKAELESLEEEQAQTALDGETADSSASESEHALNVSQPTRNASSEMNEEVLRGSVLTIRGKTTAPEALAEYSAALVEKAVLRRMIAIKCRFDESSSEGSKFTIIGELQ